CRRGIERSADGGARALDQSLRDDFPPAADGSGRRLLRAHFHTWRRAPLRRASDARLMPRLARRGRKAVQIESRRTAMRPRARAPWHGSRLECVAPPLRRAGVLEPDVLAKIVKALTLLPSDIVHHQWVDNGPGWCAVMLGSAGQVLSLKPDWASLVPLKLGVV